MFKLIFFLIGLAIAILLSAFNIGNTSTISFGFATLLDIPVFLSIAIAFFAGAVFTLPFAFSVSIGNKRAKKSKNKEKNAQFVNEQMIDELSPRNLENKDL